MKVYWVDSETGDSGGERTNLKNIQKVFTKVMETLQGQGFHGYCMSWLSGCIFPSVSKACNTAIWDNRMEEKTLWFPPAFLALPQESKPLEQAPWILCGSLQSRPGCTHRTWLKDQEATGIDTCPSSSEDGWTALTPSHKPPNVASVSPEHQLL